MEKAMYNKHIYGNIKNNMIFGIGKLNKKVTENHAIIRQKLLVKMIK
jgi:hypothetical protein